MRKKIFIFFIYGLIAVVSLAILFFFGIYRTEEVRVKEQQTGVPAQENKESNGAPQPKQQGAQATQEKAEQVTLSVGDLTYTTKISPHSTVIEVMSQLASTTSFTFVATTYPGLGVFVETINGIRFGQGKYWILYVNGISATVGASNYGVKDGDHIEWKFEKSN